LKIRKYEKNKNIGRSLNILRKDLTIIIINYNSDQFIPCTIKFIIDSSRRSLMELKEIRCNLTNELIIF